MQGLVKKCMQLHVYILLHMFKYFIIIILISSSRNSSSNGRSKSSRIYFFTTKNWGIVILSNKCEFTIVATSIKNVANAKHCVLVWM